MDVSNIDTEVAHMRPTPTRDSSSVHDLVELDHALGAGPAQESNH